MLKRLLVPIFALAAGLAQAGPALPDRVQGGYNLP